MRKPRKNYSPSEKVASLRNKQQLRPLTSPRQSRPVGAGVSIVRRPQNATG